MMVVVNVIVMDKFFVTEVESVGILFEEDEERIKVEFESQDKLDGGFFLLVKRRLRRKVFVLVDGLFKSTR